MYITDRALHCDNQVLNGEKFHKPFPYFNNNNIN